MKFAFFHSDGKKPCVRQDLKLILTGLQRDLSYDLSMRILIISSPRAIYSPRDLIECGRIAQGSYVSELFAVDNYLLIYWNILQNDLMFRRSFEET